MSDPIETEIFDLLAKREPGKSICPSEVAKIIAPDRWQREMGKVRAVATGLARQGRLVITKKGKPVNPEAFKGVIRLKLPETSSPAHPGESRDPELS